MKQQLDTIIAGKCEEAIAALYHEKPSAQQIQIQKTRKEFEGDVTLVVFPLLKLTRKSPEDSGNEIGEWLQNNVDDIVEFNVVKGFLNLSISETTLLTGFNQVIANKNFGKAPSSGRTVMVEYSSPNTNKPLHLGHLRNVFLGYSVSQILENCGHEVVKVQVINDRGIHICKSMLAWQKWGNNETPGELKGDKLVGKYYVKFDQEYKKEIEQLVATGINPEEAEKCAPLLLEAQEMLRKWEAGDAEVMKLWNTMNQWVYDGFDATYNRMGVDFDKLYYESDTFIVGKDKVMKGLADEHFYKKEDGSVWVDLEPQGLDQKLLLRADGTAVYMTQDIGTAILRYEDYPKLNQLIYTVGNEQEYHFKVLFLILEKLGFEWAKECYHLSYGMIDLPSGKMKSREGTVVDADDLMQEMVDEAEAITKELGKLGGVSETEKEELYEVLGLGALKYFLLKVDPKKRMLFDPKESIDFQGNTGPFIQYAHARIQSILRKAGTTNATVPTNSTMEPAERELLKRISEYPEVVLEAGENYSPAIIANYIYELVKSFNHFYQTVPILKEEDQHKVQLRVALSQQTGRVINTGMALLGISVPDQM